MLSSLLLCVLSQGLPASSAPALQGRVFLMRSPSSPARSGYFPDLRSALALSDDGDSLILEPGLYTGPGNVGLVVTEDVAIRGRYGADSTVIDCEKAGRAFDLQSVEALVQGLTIRDGQADFGGGARVRGGIVLFQDVAFEGCSASGNGGGVFNDFFSRLFLERCRFLGNSSPIGGGVTAGGTAQLTDCLFEDNEATVFGGGLAAAPDLSQEVRASGCIFRRNRAGSSGGGAAHVLFGATRLDRCVVVDNEAPSGAGIAILGGSFGLGYVTSSVIVGNKAQTGAGGIFGAARVGITNCTVVANSSLSSSAGGVRTGSTGAPAAIINSLIRGNTSGASTALERQVQGNPGPFTEPDLTLLFSNVEGLSGSPTNIDLDPLFVDPASGDYHILPSSPCVDAGLAFTLTNLQQDIDGEPRFQGLSVDIGCDELAPPGGS